MQLIVSRHDGAIEFLKQSYPDAKIVRVFNIEMVERGSFVVGNLPIHLVAEICEKGAEFWSLVLPIKGEIHRRELTAQELAQKGAKVVQYIATKAS